MPPGPAAVSVYNCLTRMSSNFLPTTGNILRNGFSIIVRPILPVPGIVKRAPDEIPMSSKYLPADNTDPVRSTFCAAFNISAALLAFCGSFAAFRKPFATSAALAPRANSPAPAIYVKGSKAISNPRPTAKSKGPGRSTSQSRNTSPIMMLSRVC